MAARLNIHCSHPVAADPILYVEGIDLNWKPPRLRNHVFDVRNLNGVVRLPEDLSFHHFGTIENPMGEPLDRNRSLADQAIVSEGDLYMVVRLMGPAGPAAGGGMHLAEVDVVSIVQNALGGVLDEAQQLVLRRREFVEDWDYVVRETRSGQQITRDFARNLCRKLSAFITTHARRRVSTSSGYFFDGRLGGTEARQRPSDLYFVLSTTSPAMYVGKVYAHADAATAEKEFNLSNRLHHGGHQQALVRYSDRLYVGDRVALIMPVFTRTLEQVVQREFSGLPTPMWLVRRVVVGTLQALVALHKLGHAHCDVKPDNIMFGPDAQPVLIDLGSATAFGQSIEESAPASVLLDYEGPSAPRVDLIGLASTIWYAVKGLMPPARSVEGLRVVAEQAAAAHGGDHSAMVAIAAILQAESAEAALQACASV